MRNSILSSLLLLFIVFACRKPAATISTEQMVKPEEILVSPFNKKDSTFLYKTAVDTYGKYLSGLLFIKNLDNNHYRLVFTTEVGVKLFDMEIGPDKLFNVYYCIEQMDRKVVLDLLQADFRQMLVIPPYLSNTAMVSNADGNKRVKLKADATEYHYIIDGKTSDIKEFKNIYGKTKAKTKLNIIFGDYSNGIPGNIFLKHENIQLSISMNYLKR
ncbi:MAG: hypothetical protein ACK40G_14170 [Cytophagaceae bacterium]